MSKPKKSTKIIEPTTTSEMKESEMKSHSKMSSSKTTKSKKTKQDESKTTSMISSIHCNKNREDRDGQIINIWNSNLQDAMTKITDIIEKYPYIALVCEYYDISLHSNYLINVCTYRIQNFQEL